MMMDSSAPAVEGDATELVSLTADVVSAYVSNNSVAVSDLAGLVGSVHASLSRLGQPQAAAAPEYVPAVSVKKSVTPDAIISLIDGKPYRTLKRHLTGHGLTPDEYRQRYGLPVGYPMVAASYAAMRSELAKSIGLGANRKKAATKAAEPPTSAPTKRRGRKTKA
jgi:predicted transcriptional regulator